MICPPCIHTHVLPLVSNPAVYRVSVISVSSSSMRIMHVAPSLIKASVHTDHCFVQVLWRSDRYSSLDRARRRSMSTSHPGTAMYAYQLFAPSPTSPEACRSPHFLHSPGTILVFLVFLPAASAAKRIEPIYLGDRRLRVHRTKKCQQCF